VRSRIAWGASGRITKLAHFSNFRNDRVGQWPKSPVIYKTSCGILPGVVLRTTRIAATCRAHKYDVTELFAGVPRRGRSAGTTPTQHYTATYNIVYTLSPRKDGSARGQIASRVMLHVPSRHLRRRADLQRLYVVHITARTNEMRALGQLELGALHRTLFVFTSAERADMVCSVAPCVLRLRKPVPAPPLGLEQRQAHRSRD
jgi:hypothetical protein